MEDIRNFDNTYEDFDPLKENNIIDANEKINPIFKEKLQNSVDSLLEYLDTNLRRGSDKDRDTSMYTGSSGIALVYFLVATKLNKKTFLKLAAELIDSALPRLKGHRLSLLTGDPGPLAVGAAVYHQLGAKEASLDLCNRLKNLLPQVLDLKSDLPDEILYGRAGYLLALLFVKRQVDDSIIEPRAIQQVVAAIVSSGKAFAKRTSSGTPLMFEWHGKKYLGAAHGICGILYVLLQSLPYLPEERQQELESLTCETLDFMLGLSFPSGNLPSSIDNNTDRLIHWCHGAPGLVHLLCLAHKEFDCSRYLEAALVCGDLVWQRGLLKKGNGLCHGVAGNAYTFIQLYQTTKDTKHLYRALRFAEWCISSSKHQTRTPDRPFSLFEGIAGTIYFLQDVQNPMDAKFPAFSM